MRKITDMKTLIEILTEEGMATPGGTMGMGNPMATNPAESPGALGEPGSEPVGKACKKCKKKKKID